MLVLGLSTAVVGLCYLSSVAFIPVTVAAVVFYTYPSLIVLASPLVDGTRLTPRLAGVVAHCARRRHSRRGAGLRRARLARPCACADGRRSRPRRNSSRRPAAARPPIVAKVFWIHLIVLPTALLLGASPASSPRQRCSALAPFAVALTIGGYVLGFVLQFAALGRISAAVAGIAYCVEPVVAAVASTFVLGESLDPLQMFGGALVLAAIVANMMPERRRAALLVATD